MSMFTKNDQFLKKVKKIIVFLAVYDTIIQYEFNISTNERLVFISRNWFESILDQSEHWIYPYAYNKSFRQL